MWYRQTIFHKNIKRPFTSTALKWHRHILNNTVVMKLSVFFYPLIITTFDIIHQISCPSSSSPKFRLKFGLGLGMTETKKAWIWAWKITVKYCLWDHFSNSGLEVEVVIGIENRIAPTIIFRNNIKTSTRLFLIMKKSKNKFKRIKFYYFFTNLKR